MTDIVRKESAKAKAHGVSKVGSGEYALVSSKTNRIWQLLDVDKDSCMIALISTLGLTIFSLSVLMMLGFAPILVFLSILVPMLGGALFALLMFLDGMRNAKPGGSQMFNWRTTVSGKAVTSNGDDLFSHRTRSRMIVESGLYHNENKLLRVSEKVILGHVIKQHVEIYEKRTAVWDEAVDSLLASSAQETKGAK